MVHNHDIEFSTKFGNRTVFDIIAANTDPRNVVFQLDLYWVTFGGADPVAVLKRYGKRIQLFHVKDMRGSDRRIEIVGRGVINFPKIFAAGKNIRYYVVEHDPRCSPPRTVRPVRGGRGGLRLPRQREVQARQGHGHGHDKGHGRGHDKGRGRGHDKHGD